MDSQVTSMSAYELYKAKLSMIGINIDSLFKVKSTGISVDILGLAAALGYPEILHIPAFTNFLELSPFWERGVYRCIVPGVRSEFEVKKIVLPDEINLDDKALYTLNQFPELETISLTEQQYKAVSKIKYRCEIRYKSRKESKEGIK